MESVSRSPTCPDFVQDPYPFYDEARARGPIVHWREYDLPVATTHASVDALLRDRRLGREIVPERRAPVPPHLRAFYRVEDNSMLELEAPRHTRLRKRALRSFTSRRSPARSRPSAIT